MSTDTKLIATSAIRGAHQVVANARDYLARAIAAKGIDSAVGFPDTFYSLPVIYSMLGERVDKLSDMGAILERCEQLLPPAPSESVWLPYLGSTLDAGMATLFAFEIIEACKCLIGPNPVNGIWLGAASDVILRERGIEFVDGSAPGFAAIVGAAPTSADAVRIARELQEKNLYTFIAGNTNGVSFAEQLEEAGVQTGWETRLVPFGKDISAAIYALGFANRAALAFGNIKPGDYERNLHYNKDRIFAFVMALGEVTDEKYAAAAGAISYGFPTIADTDIPEILPSGICTYEHVVSSVPIDRIVEKCLEVRGCKVKVTKMPIPVAYGAAFEGERIRKEQTYLEFGGSRSQAFEYVTTRDLADIENGKITVVGPDIDQVVPGTALPLGIWVEVAGRKMQADFEPILERQIHHIVNGGEGVWHMGQRDINWIRISKAAQEKGFTIRHIGDMIHVRLVNDYPAIVDKVQITLFTEKDEIDRRIKDVRQVYRARNQRMESLTDDSVDTFYSCLLCQSFAPSHVCVITPERLGLCGAYNWLDGKAAYEIDPTGPNQPLEKGECLDPVRGQWENINKYVYANSKQTVECFNAYSMLEFPMTSCGCFEAIVALLPECNGVMLVNREYLGQTPSGMKFSTLASMAGGGQQTPGFLGIGKAYITSRKFIAAEGGHQRIVWMPSILKERLREDFELIGKNLGLENFLDMIADDTVATDLAGVQEHLKKVNHPALSMWEITSPSPEAAAVDAARAEKNNGANGAAATLVAMSSATPAATAAPIQPAAELARPAGRDLSPDIDPAKPTGAVHAAEKPSSVSGHDRVPSGWRAANAAISTGALAPAACCSVHSPDSTSSPEVNLENQVPSGPVAPQPLAPIIAATQSANGIAEILAVLERLRTTPLQTQLQPGMSTEQQMAALQSSTALHLLHAGTNMLLMYSGLLGPAPTAVQPSPVAPPVAETKPAPATAVPVIATQPAVPAKPPKLFSSSRIALPSSFKLPEERSARAIRSVTLGGSGTRTSAVTIGGAEVLPFRHFEGKTGHRPVIAMEVFDQELRGYPQSLHDAYGSLLTDPAAMAKYCVEQLGAEVISVRLMGTHPENGDRSPEASADLIKDVLKAVGVPLIITGTNHFEKNNAVMKHIAAAFAGENLLLNWAETDNYKTMAAAAMGYNHCIVAQAPIDVNMSKQLNILLTNMGVAPDKIVIDPYTGALGYGLEYTYSVMERIRTSAFAGDAMLAMPMVTTPGYEVARIKESKAPVSAFPLWGPEAERGALIEIATATSLLNAGSDLLVLYHPVAARTMKRKIEEMTAC